MALTEEDKKELYKKQQALTDEDFLAMDDVEFRARFRERVHHTLEIQTYSAAYRNKTLSKNQADYAKRLIKVWEQRGLSTELSDYRYAQKLIGFAEDLIHGKQISFDEYAPVKVTEDIEKDFFTVLYERRSVREFTNQEVTDELIDKILNAGLWAAHSCNLQSIRYLVVREANVPGLFKGSDIPGGPVHLVVLQDKRVYKANQFMPDRNHLLDAGAAAQNIALAAHAVGLEGVWLTFDNTIISRLREYFKVPEYVDIVTYVDIGYGDQTPYAPQRSSLNEVVLGRA
jgi:nitroreductase